MKQIKLIIQREYFTKIRSKSFIVMTFVSPLVVVLLSVFIGYLTSVNEKDEKKLTILDETSQFNSVFKNNKSYKYRYITKGDINKMKQLSLEKKEYGILHIYEFSGDYKFYFFSQESPSTSFLETLTSDLERVIFQKNLEKNHIQTTEIENAKQKAIIELESYSGEKTSNFSGILKIIFGIVAGYLLMMFIVIYGNMIMRSVIEEKTSRIVEIIVSSVQPIKLMLGKIIGISLVGLTQVVMWLIIGGVLMTIITRFVGVTPSFAVVNASTPTTLIISDILLEFFKFPIMKLIASFLIFFIGGNLLYNSLYAAIGASVDSETDTQQFIFPVLTPLIVAVYVGFFTVLENPNGVIAIIFSYIPLTSSVTMLMRIPFGVSWTEIGISAVILYACFFGVLWFASKIYRIGILSYGKKTSYKDIYKWLKMK